MEYVAKLARIQLRFFVGEPPRCSSSCGRGISLLAKGRFRLFCPLPAPPALTLGRMCAFTLPALMLRAGARRGFKRVRLREGPAPTHALEESVPTLLAGSNEIVLDGAPNPEFFAGSRLFLRESSLSLHMLSTVETETLHHANA